MIVATDAKRKSVLMNQDDGYNLGETWKTVMPYIYENEIEPKFRRSVDEDEVRRRVEMEFRRRRGGAELRMSDERTVDRGGAKYDEAR